MASPIITITTVEFGKYKVAEWDNRARKISAIIERTLNDGIDFAMMDGKLTILSQGRYEAPQVAEVLNYIHNQTADNLKTLLDLAIRYAQQYPNVALMIDFLRYMQERGYSQTYAVMAINVIRYHICLAGGAK